MIKFNVNDLKFVFSNLNLKDRYTQQPLKEMIEGGENFTFKGLENLDSPNDDVEGDNHIRMRFYYKNERFTWYIDTQKFFKCMRRFKLEKIK